MTLKKNAARVAVQAELCPISPKSQAVEWEVVNDSPREMTLNEIIDDLVTQVETQNGAPICIFMPLVTAVLAKQRRLNALNGGAA